MRKLLYCVFSTAGREAPAPPALRGVDARPVDLVSYRSLCAATSPFAGARVAATLARVEAHDRVVEAFFRERTVVPMRFGSVLESDAAVVRYLRDHAASFRARLRELSGCVEMGVRLVAPARIAVPPEPKGARAARPRQRASGSGRAYLEARAERRRAAEGRAPDVAAVVERYRGGLRGLFTRVMVEPPVVSLVVGPEGVAALAPGESGGAAERRTLSLSFLVPRARVEAFRKAFGELPRDGAASRLSGPWPPYSFVTQVESGAP